MCSGYHHLQSCLLQRSCLIQHYFLYWHLALRNKILKKNKKTKKTTISLNKIQTCLTLSSKTWFKFPNRQPSPSPHLLLAAAHPGPQASGRWPSGHFSSAAPACGCWSYWGRVPVHPHPQETRLHTPSCRRTPLWGKEEPRLTVGGTLTKVPSRREDRASWDTHQLIKEGKAQTEAAHAQNKLLTDGFPRNRDNLKAETRQ